VTRASSAAATISHLRAETPADVLGDDVYLGGLEAPAFRRLRRDRADRLGRQVQVQIAVVVPAGDAGMGLQ
jgi:hypothetical protein